MSLISVLKKDYLGSVHIVRQLESATPQGLYVRRNTDDARPGLRWLAWRLGRREAAALAIAAGVPGVPRLLRVEGRAVQREYLPGRPMHEARPASAEYFRSALKLLIALHRRGIVHNDLAKEANWLCTPEGGAAVVDFQVAMVSRRRGPLFRALAREDLRHLLKHKRTYLPDGLTLRQRALLDTPGLVSRLWAGWVKPPYRFVTRRLLRWPERVGAAERGDSP